MKTIVGLMLIASVLALAVVSLNLFPQNGTQTPPTSSLPLLVSIEAVYYDSSIGTDVTESAIYLYRMPPDGSGWIKMYQGVHNEPLILPTCSPSGTKFAFVQKQFVSSAYPGLFIMSVEGGEPTRILEEDHIRSIAWSPDEKEVLLVIDGPILDIDYIAVVNIDERTFTKLHEEQSIDAAYWAPNGTKIVFAAGYEEKTHIATMDSDGSNVVDFGLGKLPAFFPDGDLAFVNGSNIVIVSNGNKLNLEVKLTQCEGISFLSISPSGKKMLYVDDSGFLYTLNRDGSNIKKLVSVGLPPQWLSSKTYAVWSPDPNEEKIAFIGLSVINADGSGLVRLLKPDIIVDYSWRSIVSGP